MSNIDAISVNLANAAVTHDIITETIRSMRTHLGMEIGYLSEFVDDQLIFRAVDAPGLEHLVKPGDVRALSETYCKHILAGGLPQLMSDALEVPLAAAMAVTREVPIRAHISVPIERRDGSIYGMFCCLSPRPNATLNIRDLELMRTFARLAQSEVQRSLELKVEAEKMMASIDHALDSRNFEMVYQPIFNLVSGDISGLEALCRFKTDPYRAPNLWFDDAARVGKAEKLEICVIETALTALSDIPEGIYLSLNASPETVASGHLADIFRPWATERLVIEVTEHVQVADWAVLDRELHRLREMGIRIAIDDAGAGYSGLQQMVRLHPDIIKLDRSLVDCIDDDRARRSLCAAMVHYAKETGAALVAEGIERPEEAAALRSLGVDRGQGYWLAKPMPLKELLANFSNCGAAEMNPLRDAG